MAVTPELWAAAEHAIIGAAEQGSSGAMLLLGGFSENPPARDIEPDLEMAKRRFRRAADVGDPIGAFELARLMSWNSESVVWLRKAAAAGHVEARRKLHDLFPQTRRTDENAEQPGAADPAMVDTADMGSVIPVERPRDEEGLRSRFEWKWIRQAAEPDEGAVRRLARASRRRGHLAEAADWYRKAVFLYSNHNDIFNLALLVFEPHNNNEAEFWLSLATDLDPRGVLEIELPDLRLPGAGDRVVSLGPFSRPETVAETVAAVAVTAAVLPFIATIAKKTAEDTYASARDYLRRLMNRHEVDSRECIVVVNDPNGKLRLHIRSNPTDEQLRRLADLDLDDVEAKATRGRTRVVIRWNPHRNTWESR